VKNKETYGLKISSRKNYDDSKTKVKTKEYATKKFAIARTWKCPVKR
jgi:hypothetical protein